MNANIQPKDLETWADYLIDHSLKGVTPDDVVMIKGEHITWPLMAVLQDKIFKAGAIADINLVSPDNNRGMVWGSSIARHGSVPQIQRTPTWHLDRYNAMTKYIEILGAENPSLFANLPEDTAAALFKADEPYKNIRLLKPWVLTLYPTQAFADLEGMTLEEYAAIVVGASVTNPAMLDEVEQPLFELMHKAETITIVTRHPATRKELNLRMNIKDRIPVKCTGHRNFPDGEVFTSPDARSVEGEIFVDLPVYYNGATMQGIYLKFDHGVIVDYNADKEHDTLKKIIETDEGSHRLGEVALGMNNGLQTALKHPLFVEKVGGTCHIAIGASYPECYVPDPTSDDGKKRCDILAGQGILNRSAQHVDIVTDFRDGGTGQAIYLDDTKLEVKDNLWVIP